MTTLDLLKINNGSSILFTYGTTNIYQTSFKFKNKDYYICYYKKGLDIRFEGLNHYTNNEYTYAFGFSWNGTLTFSYYYKPVDTSCNLEFIEVD